MNMVALIPARGGSKRIPRKNIRPFAGHPLMVYTIAAANASGVFSSVVVSTDDEEIRALAYQHGVHGMFRSSPESSTDDAPDILWVRDYFKREPTRHADVFAILRPTSPFRTAATIRRAFEQFGRSEVHSIRAMQPVKEHPGKMWQYEGPGCPIEPLIGLEWPACGGRVAERIAPDRPFHSLPTQTLPRVYIQNASLEMAWWFVVQSYGTISGTKVAPFFTEGVEGLDLNTEEDWQRAEQIAAVHPDWLPAVSG